MCSPKKSETGTLGFVGSIETLGALDGPGLRTVVFLQGCSLACKYCHNPECIAIGAAGRSIAGATTAGLTARAAAGATARATTARATVAATVDARGVVDQTPPISTGTEYSAPGLATELLKYKGYWGQDPQAGGVTFSGGEPLLQAAFICQVSQKLPAEVHITIDTSLFVPKYHIDELLERVNYWMVSVKHLDTQAHRFLTGQGNKHILRNLDHLDHQLSREGNFNCLRLRYLVIPGYTDSLEYADQFALLAESMRSLDRVELLAYNSHAKAKWESLGQKFSFGGIPDASAEQLEVIAGRLRLRGIEVMY